MPGSRNSVQGAAAGPLVDWTTAVMHPSSLSPMTWPMMGALHLTLRLRRRVVNAEHESTHDEQNTDEEGSRQRRNVCVHPVEYGVRQGALG